MCKYCLSATRECPEVIDRHTHIYKNGTWEDVEQPMCGYVYFFATQDLLRIKIGYTRKNPYSRMEYYENCENSRFVMIAIWPVITSRTEKSIHKLFTQHRISKQQEWFNYHYEICSFLKSLWLRFVCGMGDQLIDGLWGIQKENS